MKKLILAGVVCSIVMLFAACGNGMNPSHTLDREGIAPYKLADGERYLLQAFGMEGDAQILSYHAPEGAASLQAKVYQLEEGDQWRSIGSGAISLGTSGKPDGGPTGTVTMRLAENFVIDYRLNFNGGSAAYRSDPIALKTPYKALNKVFLHDYQGIQVNQEMPVALMVYNVNETGMKTVALDDFHNPSKLNGIGLVQAVTLTFSDQALAS